MMPAIDDDGDDDDDDHADGPTKGGGGESEWSIPPMKYFSVKELIRRGSELSGIDMKDEDNDDDDDEGEGRKQRAAPVTIYCVEAKHVVCEYVEGGDEEDDEGPSSLAPKPSQSSKKGGGSSSSSSSSSSNNNSPGRGVDLNPHGHLPLFSRWARLDGWLEDQIIGSFDPAAHRLTSQHTASHHAHPGHAKSSGGGIIGGKHEGEGTSRTNNNDDDGDGKSSGGGNGGGRAGGDAEGRGRRRLRRQQQMVRGDVGNWFGVTVRDGRVFAVDLPSNNLIGALPSLGGLSSSHDRQQQHQQPLCFCVRLNLSRNLLSGELPVSLLQLLPSLETVRYARSL